jgi:hypothetical protein
MVACLKTINQNQAHTASTPRMIIIKEKTQTAVSIFHRRAQPSGKLNKFLFTMHLCSDYMNFDL